jgi:predicted transcriptional regulator
MAEVLGVASGIAGLLSLTIETYSITSTYIRGVRNATKAVGAFLQELKDLKAALTAINDWIESSEDEIPFESATSIFLSLEETEEYHKMLSDLQQDLKKRLTGNPALVKLKSLTWPFSEKESQEIVGRLHRHLQRLQTLTSVDSL